MSFTANLTDIVARNANGLLSVHETWQRTPLATVAQVLNGFPFDSSRFDKQRGVPLLRIRDILKTSTDCHFMGDVPPGYWVEPGDIVIGMDGDFNAARWSGPRALLNQRVCKLAVDERFMDRRFIYWCLGGYLDAVNAETPSITVKHLSSKTVGELPIPLPPRAEQQRIADKLDTVLARVDACRDRLARVAPLLKRFRQSVIAAGTSGRLTEDWRQSHKTVESGQLVVARDAAAKARQLACDASLAKKKSTANADVDEGYSFPLPHSWVFTSWGRLSEWITYGFTRPMPAASVGRKLVTAKDVHPFKLRLEDCGFTTAEAFGTLSPKDQPRRGDLLITKDGTIGRAALVESDEPFCINQSVAVVWLRSTSMNRRFLEFVANVDYTQRFVLEKAKGMAIQHLSITDFAQCPVPVPPMIEQEEIVKRVEVLLAFADRVESRLAQAQYSVNRLTPSLLAKAFRGELVPQDPADEPAAELLKRLALQRETAPPRPRRSRSTA